MLVLGSGIVWDVEVCKVIARLLPMGYIMDTIMCRKLIHDRDIGGEM